MDGYDNSVLTLWSFGLVGVAYLAFSFNLIRQGYWRPNANPVGLSLLGAVFTTSLWGWLTMLTGMTGERMPELAAALADVLRYALWFSFLLLLIRPEQPLKPSRNLRTLTIAAITLVLASLFIRVSIAFELLPAAAALNPLISMALSIFGLVLVEQVFRNVLPDSRWNLKPISLALVGTFAFDVYLYSQAVIFNQVDFDASTIRGAVHALMAPLLWLAVTRRRDWIAHLRVSRGAAFYSAALLICGGYLLFISAVGYYVRFFGGDWGRALQLGLVFVSLVGLTTLSLSGTWRAKLRVFLSKNFFRYRYDYREEWLKFTRALSAQSTPQEMGQQVIRGLADLVESPGGGLWMRMPAAQSFQQTARLNLAARTEIEDAASDLCAFMRADGKVINLEEFRSFPRRYGSMAVPPWLGSIPQAWLLVPLMVGDELIGFVVLLSARTPVEVNWEVYDLLRTASRQAASFLAQMLATEALLEVRKFDAFNRMSAFVVHDLKNIVTQLSLMMKNAKRLHANPEFQQDMLITVDNSLEKMRQLMTQLREGTTPAGTAFGVNLEGIVRRIESVTSSRGRQIEIRGSEPVVARGHEERLERVVGHVVQNALDATDQAGQVWLQLDKVGGQARIVVGDTGHGMSTEFVRDRLFKPFQTTKPTGMGIGAYESFQYVQELGGKVLVESEPDQGTRVTLLVPLFEGQTESDLDVLKAPV